MLFRRDGDETIAITQPSHAWLSGQIVRAWGNDVFAKPVPVEDVCLGAELPDIGWSDWDAAPPLNAATGLDWKIAVRGTSSSHSDTLCDTRTIQPNKTNIQ